MNRRSLLYDNLVKVSNLFFSLVVCTFSALVKKSFPTQGHKNSLYFLLKYWKLAISLQIFIHLELIFVVFWVGGSIFLFPCGLTNCSAHLIPSQWHGCHKHVRLFSFNVLTLITVALQALMSEMASFLLSSGVSWLFQPLCLFLWILYNQFGKFFEIGYGIFIGILLSL